MYVNWYTIPTSRREENREKRREEERRREEAAVFVCLFVASGF
jgi:hypothetical protein